MTPSPRRSRVLLTALLIAALGEVGTMVVTGTAAPTSADPSAATSATR